MTEKTNHRIITLRQRATAFIKGQKLPCNNYHTKNYIL